jgi:hypothetical protein
MKKKKVEAPVYEQWAGNEYTDRAREGIGTYGNWIDANWEPLTQTYTPEDMKEIAQRAYDTSMNDFLGNYNKQANAIAARNYNRFGGLGSTPSLYTTDMLNKQANDEAARLASQMYSLSDQLANNQMNRNLSSLGTVYNMYNNAGNIATGLDLDNWKIRNNNIEAKYAADVQNANRGGFSLGNMLSGAASGAAQGGSIGGGWGALAGGVLGGVTGGLSGSNVDGKQAAQLGGSFGNIGGNLGNWLNTKGQGFKWVY